MFRKRYRNLFTAGFLILVGLATGCRSQENTGTLQLSLEQDRIITVGFGQAYTEPGYTAFYMDNGVKTDVPVTIEGAVDAQKLGNYLLKYKAQYGNSAATDYRLIKVVDTEAPEIVLVQNPNKETLPGETYQEDGFIAIDNYDRDITDKVQRKDTGEKVIYTVSDSSGNTTTVERTIAGDLLDFPMLLLDGNRYMTLRTGQQYEEPGFLAVDKQGRNISGKVTVSGLPDMEKPGVYTVKYSVQDEEGNFAAAIRKITVIELQNNPNGDQITDGKVIYLTFDDGPGKHTERLLSILRSYNVKATFFVTNQPKYNSCIGQAYREGHTVAIHTNTHKYSQIYTGVDAYFQDLEAVQAIIREQTGTETMLLRFPGGSSNTVSKKYCPGIMTRLTKVVEERGFRYFDWNVDSKDAGGAKTADEVYRNVISGIREKQNAVVLQHDIKGFSVDAVERIIVWGLENGYTFLPMNYNTPECHHRVNN